MKSILFGSKVPGNKNVLFRDSFVSMNSKVFGKKKTSQNNKIQKQVIHHAKINPKLDKIALIIGANNYKYSSKLTKPVDEMNQVYQMLIKNGFTVLQLTNPTVQNIQNGLRLFLSSLDKNTLSYFHFSGHGVIMNNKHYLIPCDWNRMTYNYDIGKKPHEWNCIHVEDLMFEIKKQSLPIISW